MVFDRLEELSRSAVPPWFGGVWIEDKNSGTILLQAGSPQAMASTRH